MGIFDAEQSLERLIDTGYFDSQYANHPLFLKVALMRSELMDKRKRLEHIERKVRHGCADALCSDCDGE